MHRNQMIIAIEEAWYKFYADNPGEPEGDVPAAVQYYRTIPMAELVEEYERMCK